MVEYQLDLRQILGPSQALKDFSNLKGNQFGAGAESIFITKLVNQRDTQNHCVANIRYNCRFGEHPPKLSLIGKKGVHLLHTSKKSILPLVFQAALTLEPGDTMIAKQLQMLQKRQRKARGDCSELIDQNEEVEFKNDPIYLYDREGTREGEAGGDTILS